MSNRASHLHTTQYQQGLSIGDDHGRSTFPFLFRHGQQATSMIFLPCSLSPGEDGDNFRLPP